MSKNWSYKITDKNHPHYGKTLWSGRYCAVTGILWWSKYYNTSFPLSKDLLDEIYILVERRGTGAADYQGKWCMPCGFLECDETGEQGLSREFYEETGILVEYSAWELFNVQTNPAKCNNGNVTIRYAMNILEDDTTIDSADKLPKPNYKNINGEANEVAEVKWIKLSEIDNYDWCFNHDELLKEFFQKVFDYINGNN